MMIFDGLDMDTVARIMAAQSARALERDLHDQVESDRCGHDEPERESNPSQCELRLDRAFVGRRARRELAYPQQAH
jgi:hypothetical protein